MARRSPLTLVPTPPEKLPGYTDARYLRRHRVWSPTPSPQGPQGRAPTGGAERKTG